MTSSPGCPPPTPLPPTVPGPTMVGLDPISSLCTTGHPANILTGILVRLLREHFANPANLEYNGTIEFQSDQGEVPLKQLQSYIWNSDNAQTRIQIQSVWDYNAEDIQRRPALYVKRNTLQTQKLAIGDGWTFGAQRDKNGKLLQVRGDYKCIQVLGSHTVFCVGTTGAEAELLGMEVMNQFIMFAPLIQTDMKFKRFMVMECGEVALLDEFDQHFVVPVVVSYAFDMAWRIQKIAPWLKTLSIAVKPV